MEPAAEVSELLGVEASIGTQRLTISHAAKDFFAGEQCARRVRRLLLRSRTAAQPCCSCPC